MIDPTLYREGVTYYCSKCEHEKLVECFYRIKGRPYSPCKACRQATERSRYKNDEAVRTRRKNSATAWRKTERGRASHLATQRRYRARMIEQDPHYERRRYHKRQGVDQRFEALRLGLQVSKKRRSRFARTFERLGIYRKAEDK